MWPCDKLDFYHNLIKWKFTTETLKIVMFCYKSNNFNHLDEGWVKGCRDIRYILVWKPNERSLLICKSGFVCSGRWPESEWLQWTNGRGDFGFDWPTLESLSSEQELRIWNRSNVHNLWKTPDTTGPPTPSATPKSTRAKVSAAPRQSSLHWSTGPQLQQREQLVKLRLFFHIMFDSWILVHTICCDSNNSFCFSLFFLWPQLSRSKPVIWSPR